MRRRGRLDLAQMQARIGDGFPPAGTVLAIGGFEAGHGPFGEEGFLRDPRAHERGLEAQRRLAHRDGLPDERLSRLLEVADVQIADEGERSPEGHDHTEAGEELRAKRGTLPGRPGSPPES